jgi:quinol-cytochrome oxidoreductase complex cytochrome b subunit
MRPSFFYHLHPPTIPAEQARWRYTLGAGGTGVFLLLVVAVTGILEMFYYIPTPERAAQSVQQISYLVPFGGLVRNLHFWSAQLLVVVAAIHLARVVFTGAYAPPRRFNYLLGLALFVFSILMDFTGYVLRWDKGVEWALVVGTNLVKSIPGIGEGSTASSSAAPRRALPP